jgi:hypothetical protein
MGLGDLKTLAEDQPGDCLDERMIAALLRDLTSAGGAHVRRA